MEEVYEVVERAIDVAFKEQKFLLKLYDYLKGRNTKRTEAKEFIESSTATNINFLVIDLDEYIKGGQDNEHKQLREAYGHIPKPQARKIRNYLYGILDDAWRYENDRKPGRRKKQSK